MATPAPAKIGRNDPCPCGSGKKYKRCCMEREATLHEKWSREREACDELTRDMMEFAALHLGGELEEAWKDFEMSDFPEPLDEHEIERQIFIPYFLFHWDPFRPRRGKATLRHIGVVFKV